MSYITLRIRGGSQGGKKIFRGSGGRNSPIPRCKNRSDSAAIEEAIAARLRLSDVASRRDAACKPDVSANRRASPNGDPAQNRRAGIDHDIILDDGVPCAALDQSAAVIHRKPLGP